MENLNWFETLALSYQAVVFVALILLDLLIIANPKVVIKYTFLGALLVLVLGFAGFAAAVVVAMSYRLLVRSFLWMRLAFTDPNKFWTSFKLFEIKDYR